MTIVTLAPLLDLTAAGALKQELLDAFAQQEGAQDPGVTVAAGAVQRISSPCLQVLAAAVKQGAVLSEVSPALAETAALLGLDAALGLEQA